VLRNVILRAVPTGFELATSGRAVQWTKLAIPRQKFTHVSKFANAFCARKSAYACEMSLQETELFLLRVMPKKICDIRAHPTIYTHVYTIHLP
jgi:hypothetical protein